MISIAIFFVVLIAIWNKNHSFNWFKAKEDKTDTAPKHIENHPKTDIAPKHIQDLATRYLEPISEDHWKSLYRKKRQFIAKDEFGIEDESGQHKWNQEMIRYIDKIILPNAALNDKQLCLDHVRTFNLQASF